MGTCKRKDSGDGLSRADSLSGSSGCLFVVDLFARLSCDFSTEALSERPNEQLFIHYPTALIFIEEKPSVEFRYIAQVVSILLNEPVRQGDVGVGRRRIGLR